MRSSHLVFAISAAASMAALLACSSSAEEPAADSDADGGSALGASTPPTSTTPASAALPTGAVGTGEATGLPCDVQAVLENRCITCHGGPAVGGANAPGAPSLMTYADLTSKSSADPTKTRAQLAVEYLKATRMPLPPAVPPAPDELAAFVSWVEAGTPSTTVACTDPPPKAKAADAGAPSTAPKCTSGKMYTGNEGSPQMHPGRACNACHQLNDGPNLRVAGTVYPTQHEPDDCNGSAPPPQLTVIVTDSRNRTFRMNVNQAGNFYTSDRPRPPLKAQITDGTKTRQMQGSVTSGDCNSCHTTAGLNGAPGRIMAP
jgi:hypothetical protein